MNVWQSWYVNVVVAARVSQKFAQENDEREPSDRDKRRGKSPLPL
jgi:hypothetical protein